MVGIRRFDTKSLFRHTFDADPFAIGADGIRRAVDAALPQDDVGFSVTVNTATPAENLLNEVAPFLSRFCRRCRRRVFALLPIVMPAL